MNKLDKQYTDLLQDILDNGVKKEDRTGTGTLSVFGRQIRHKMSDGFPLITTKKMPFKTITTELLWFLRGETNIKYLIDNNCHIWDGDAYKNYVNNPDYKAENVADLIGSQAGQLVRCPTIEEFINKIKTDDEFAKKWGDLGPVYGKQWRAWGGYNKVPSGWEYGSITHFNDIPKNDQIVNSINLLKTDPDSRRNKVSAWNVGELDQMTLPPCHTDFQFYTRELSFEERKGLVIPMPNLFTHEDCDAINLPKRAISLMWNQRSVDTFLGLPFNIASYGLLLEIVAKSVNMIPDELIGNLGDTHLYLNHIEQAKEQIGRKFTEEEIQEHLMQSGMDALMIDARARYIDNLPKKTREPYPLPTLNINTEFWPTESGECGIGDIDAVAVFNNFTDEHFCKCLLEEDIQLSGYQSHPHIKAPLSN
jgi:thymidylate synthase